MDLLLRFLPEPVQHVYATYYAPYAPYLYPFATRTFLLLQSAFYNYLYPVCFAAYNFLTHLSGFDPSDGAIVSIFFTLVAAYVGFVVLNFVRRRIVALIYNVLSILFWGWIAALSVYVYNRGIDKSLEDFMQLVEFFGQLEQKGEMRGQDKAEQKAWEARRKRNSR